jgi:hypothetical protein
VEIQSEDCIIIHVFQLPGEKGFKTGYSFTTKEKKSITMN